MPIQQKEAEHPNPANKHSEADHNKAECVHSLFLRRKLTTRRQQQSRAVLEET